jgi:hypothetical protein
LSGRRLAGPLEGEVRRLVDSAMIKPLEIVARSRQRIVEELRWLANVYRPP